MYYKVKLQNNKFIIVDCVEDKKNNDNKFLYLTAKELKMLKDECIINKLKVDTTLLKDNL